MYVSIVACIILQKDTLIIFHKSHINIIYNTYNYYFQVFTFYSNILGCTLVKNLYQYTYILQHSSVKMSKCSLNITLCTSILSI